jgi:hypothetical protein
MTAHFKSNYSDAEAFQLRADLLRPMFGLWDVEDLVSHAILDVVEAQRELNDLFADDAQYGSASTGAFRAVLKKRQVAGETLLAALND